jgi:hypothetical protein
MLAARVAAKGPSALSWLQANYMLVMHGLGASEAGELALACRGECISHKPRLPQDKT